MFSGLIWFRFYDLLSRMIIVSNWNILDLRLPNISVLYSILVVEFNQVKHIYAFWTQTASPKRPKRHPPVGWPVGAFKPWTSQFKTMSWRTVAAMLLGTKSEGNEQSRHL